MTTMLPTLTLPAPNRCVLAYLDDHALRDPDTAAGWPLYLQRLDLVVIPHERAGAGWVCTAAGKAWDRRTPVGAFRIGDVEIAAGIKVRAPFSPTADLYPAELCVAWAVRVWDRWPGGQMVKVAQALLEAVDPEDLTVATGPDARTDLARRAGLPYSRGLNRPIRDLTDAGLLRVVATGDDERYQLRLPGAVA